MIHDVDSRIKTLKLDDIIRGVYTQVKYTHDIIVDKTRPMFNCESEYYHYRVHYKQFLLYYLIDGKWESQPVYIESKGNAIKVINHRDLKIFKDGM